MKEKLKKYEDALIVAGVVALTGIPFVLGVRYGERMGYQRGCDHLFCSMVKEFPELNYGNFLKRYHG